LRWWFRGGVLTSRKDLSFVTPKYYSAT